jgi:alpha-tubulin suppressor-like RCC1 family protein
MSHAVRLLVLLGAGALFGLTLASCTPPAGSDPVIDIATGVEHSCALRRSGKVLCWGENQFGQLGNGTTTNSAKPTPVSGLSDATAIASDGASTCALHLFGGTVSCWGSNSSGELGNGTTVDSDVPVAVSGLTGAIGIAAGYDHACALLGSGTIECWGYNSGGQLGNGTTTDSSTPVAVASSAVWKAVVAGGLNTCAIDSLGHAACWGINFLGQLGAGLDPTSVPQLDGPVFNVTTGLAAPPLEPVSSISIGEDHGCAVVANQGYCWGDQSFGQLGNGVISPSPSTVAVALPGFNKAAATASQFGGSCSTLALGGVDCWGVNNDGELGNGTTTPSSTPIVVSGLTSIRKVSMSNEHVCALRSDGTVSCWGENDFGQVGDGSTTNRLTPVSVL